MQLLILISLLLETKPGLLQSGCQGSRGWEREAAVCKGGLSAAAYFLSLEKSIYTFHISNSGFCIVCSVLRGEKKKKPKHLFLFQP